MHHGGAVSTFGKINLFGRICNKNGKICAYFEKYPLRWGALACGAVGHSLYVCDGEATLEQAAYDGVARA